jgi:protein involved in polysaccharide export with SLBB domain
MRVSTVLNLVNQMKKESISMAETDNYFIQQNENFRNQVFNNSGLPLNMPYSQRNVKLINKNGTSRTVDIEEAAATGDINLDPYIREGDEIFVPSDPKTYPEISISGEVIKPAKIPFRKGDNVEKLLKFGRGFTENADLDNVYHISAEGQKTKLTINPDLSVVNGNHPLNPGGMIIVGAYRQEVAEPATISILGYVRSPGNYPIINNQTKLKEAIELAGGFVDKAYLPLAYILRNNKEFYNDRTTRWNYMNSFQYSDLTLEDTTRFIMAIELKKPVVSCDFVKLFDEKAESYNITLQDGDMIVIPENPGSVYVFGQVTNPGFVAYSKDKKPDWYIEKAGGYAVKAEKSRTRVIDGRTKVWKKMEDEKLIVNAGDEIYVPKPADLPPGIELQTYAVLASTITAVIVLINLIIGLIK